MRTLPLSLAIGVIAAGMYTTTAHAGQPPEPPPDSDSGDVDADADVDIPAPKKKKKKNKKTKKAGKAAPAAMRGRFGIGAMRTVSGLNGLTARFYAADRFTVGLVAGVATFSHRDVDENGEFNRTRTVGAIGGGPEAFFWPVQGGRENQVHADFGIGLRALTYFGFLGDLPDEQTETLDTPLEVDIEIPLAVQLFIGRRVSINPEFGPVFRIIPGDREPDQNGEADSNPGTGIGQRLGTTNGPGFGFEIGDHAGFFMGIGVAFYLGKLD